VVHDEREPELKSRMVWKEYAITKAEDNYSIGGSLRAAFITSTLATTGYTALDTEVATITSKTLQQFDLSLEQFIHEYRRTSRDRSSVDAFVNSYTAPSAVGLLNPSKGQHIGKMPDLQTLHAKLVAAPTSGVMVTCHIEDRNISLAAETMGYQSQAEFVHAVNTRGRVSRTGESASDVTRWNPTLVRRLPMNIGHAD
jgi:hypothetical protein